MDTKQGKMIQTQVNGGKTPSTHASQLAHVGGPYQVQCRTQQFLPWQKQYIRNHAPVSYTHLDVYKRQLRLIVAYKIRWSKIRMTHGL